MSVEVTLSQVQSREFHLHASVWLLGVPFLVMSFRHSLDSLTMAIPEDKFATVGKPG